MTQETAVINAAVEPAIRALSQLSSQSQEIIVSLVRQLVEKTGFGLTKP